MITIENIKKNARSKSQPIIVGASAWANAMNWNIEAWKCVLDGQKWTHTFEICCPEQYFLLLDESGQFILSDSKSVKFIDTVANRRWITELENLIIDMRAKQEWTEAKRWEALVSKIKNIQISTPNEDAYKMTKRIVKGHRLIRINSAA